jgi:nucleotide-binding universal stress UspA family protein
VIHVYDTILVPTDGSDAAAAALEPAFELAATTGATVHALFVVEPVYSAEYNVQDIYDSIQEEAERVLADVADRGEAAGIEVVTAVENGTAHRRILEYAGGNGVDLVVMATHGRTGIGRYLLGSVTEKVVRLSDVPVLTVPAKAVASESAAE